MTFNPFEVLVNKYSPKVKKVRSNAFIPTKGSKYAAGFDLYACVDKATEIPAHETVMIPTGISLELLPETFGGIYARSGLATKQGLAPANKVGVIDSDYRGEVIVALHNHSDKTKVVNHGDRVAQLIIQKYEVVDLIEVDTLNDTERGEGGFGSTGE